MPSAAALRRQIEATLAHRIPSALTPAPRMVHPVSATGIQMIDAVLRGGLPVGAITEMVGPECSGRTSVALSFVARKTQAGRICAWVDVSNALDPESAAAAGVDVSRLLWVRCGMQKAAASRLAQSKPWFPIEQGLRATDLLLRAGGFSAVVLDMGSVPPEYASRVPMATWFRYRAAAEHAQASLLLLVRHPCARSSSALRLTFQPGKACQNDPTVFTGIEYRMEAAHQRFSPNSDEVLLPRKAPQNANATGWRSRTTWAAAR